jgi:ankyrin repeat protein
VPLVQCSRCVVAGDLPAHGGYIAMADQKFEARPDLASPDQIVTREKLETWLAEGSDINELLHSAVLADDIDRVKFVVEKGADVNAADSQGWTPLQHAARHRKDSMIRELIALGANPNIAGPYSMTPLVAALMRDHAPSVKALLENGADIEQPGPNDLRPLALAIAENRYEAAKALMEGGADVSVASGADGLTPLMIVAAQMAPAEGAMFLPGSTRPNDIAAGLLERKADLNAQSKTGMTALMVAATHNNAPMIGLLMDAGADPDVKNAQGQTARDVAKLNDNQEAAQAILVLSQSRAASPSATGEPESKSQ